MIDSPPTKPAPKTSNTQPDISSEEVSTIPPVARPVRTAVLPTEFVKKDVEVREGFLSDDIEVICAAATKSESTILIATAGQPMKDRKAALSIWRNRRLENLCCEELRAFLEKDASPEMVASWRDGTVDLLALDDAIANALESKAREASELRTAQKQKVKEALWRHCEGVEPPYLPQHLVVRGDGELRLFKNLFAAKNWGIEGNHGYYTVPFKIDQFHVVYPSPQ